MELHGQEIAAGCLRVCVFDPFQEAKLNFMRCKEPGRKTSQPYKINTHARKHKFHAGRAVQLLTAFQLYLFSLDLTRALLLHSTASYISHNAFDLKNMSKPPAPNMTDWIYVKMEMSSNSDATVRAREYLAWKQQHVLWPSDEM